MPDSRRRTRSLMPGTADSLSIRYYSESALLLFLLTCSINVELVSRDSATTTSRSSETRRGKTRKDKTGDQANRERSCSKRSSPPNHSNTTTSPRSRSRQRRATRGNASPGHVSILLPHGAGPDRRRQPSFLMDKHHGQERTTKKGRQVSVSDDPTNRHTPRFLPSKVRPPSHGLGLRKPYRGHPVKSSL